MPPISRICPFLFTVVLIGCSNGSKQLETKPQEGETVGLHSNVEIVGHVLEPQKIEISAKERASRLNGPSGADVTVFASDLINPRMLAVSTEGTVYVTRRAVGDVLMLKDNDGDGRAETIRPVASRPGMHGIALQGNRVFLATVQDIYVAARAQDGTLGPLRRIIDDLPDAGQHPNRTLGIGPDGALYISAGSTCNACAETNPENAALLRASPDGQSRTIFASGLRNTIGFAWDPRTNQLWGMDHGIDWLGDHAQIEELNLIEPGKKYGWPYIYGMGEFNPQDNPPEGIGLEEWQASSTTPALDYTPHSAPMQMVFYDGAQFPEYRGDAFVAMRGSWNRRPPAGYEVVRIDFEDGKPLSIEPFLSGFLQKQEGGTGYGYLGRPTGVAVAKDGALLVADDSAGVIYRVSRSSPVSSAAPSLPSAAPVVERPTELPPTSPPSLLAADALGHNTKTMAVAAPSIQPGGPIPRTHAAEGDNATPALEWSAVSGTKSYVILMEDPDARPTTPFLHWAAYNIPPETLFLPEGMPTEPKLQQPNGMMQGTNTRGSTGYYGMNPPPGDSPHHYHIQIFALDTLLDLPAGAKRDEILDAMQGHVLGTGKVIGSFRQ